MVRCTVAGPEQLLPPAFLEVPGPPVPTGLYGRVLEPGALDLLGYQRDLPVCMMLDTPTPAELEGVSAYAREIPRALVAVQREARRLGDCSCQAAREASVDRYLPYCRQLPPNPKCNTDEAFTAQVQEAVKPMHETFAEGQFPILHWRLAGYTDRPDWFFERQRELVANHPGGSEFFRPGQEMTEGGSTGLVKALLEVDGVKTVVRQDAGLGYLVVRELPGHRLVIDLFRHPKVAPELFPLLMAFQGERSAVYLRMLEQDGSRALIGKPEDASYVEYDRSGLDDVDRLVELSRSLYDLRLKAPERTELPRAPVEVAAFRVPRSNVDRVEVEYRLNDEGTAYFAPLLDATGPDVFTSMGGFYGEDEEVLRPDPTKQPAFALSRVTLPYFMRFTSLDESVFEAPAHTGRLASGVIATGSGTSGSKGSFTLQVPSGPLMRELDTPPGARGWRERFSLKPHTVSLSFRGNALKIVVEPS